MPRQTAYQTIIGLLNGRPMTCEELAEAWAKSAESPDEAGSRSYCNHRLNEMLDEGLVHIAPQKGGANGRTRIWAVGREPNAPIPMVPSQPTRKPPQPATRELTPEEHRELADKIEQVQNARSTLERAEAELEELRRRCGSVV